MTERKFILTALTIVLAVLTAVYAAEPARQVIKLGSFGHCIDVEKRPADGISRKRMGDDQRAQQQGEKERESTIAFTHGGLLRF